MTLTPQDVENQVFNQRRKGYDELEVDSFLDQVSQSLATLIRERDAARAEAEEAKRAAEEAQRSAEDSGISEDLLRRTLLSAERTAEQTVNEARTEADRLREEARAEADELRERAHAEAEELRERAERESREQREAAREAAQQVRQAIAELRAFRSDYHDRVEAVVSEQLAALERMELPEIPEAIDRLGGLDVGDGAATTRGPADARGPDAREGPSGGEGDDVGEAPSSPTLDQQGGA